MKCLFVVLAFLLLTSETRAEGDFTFKRKMAECANEMGMSNDEATIDIKDAKTRCLMACAMKKIGIMINGKLDKDSIVNFVEKYKDKISNYDKMMEDLLKCYDEATSDEGLSECDLAGKFASCVPPMNN